MISTSTMHSPAAGTLVQCDFDGTITIEDASFIMLDLFARGDWRAVHRQYETSRITVGRFNQDAFGLVRATRKELLDSIRGKVAVRPGFPEFVESCRRKDFRPVIVSNGLDFYIHEIIEEIGFPEIEVHAARTRFHNQRVSVEYIGPQGEPVDEGFKEAYTSLFLEQGRRVIYIGNGSSDYMPAKKCHHVFATGTLLRTCRKAHLECTPFSDFHDVVKELERL